MPLIKTSAKHAMLLAVPPEGRYLLTLGKVQEKLNKKGDGTNLIYPFTISAGDYEGKELIVYAGVKHDMGVATMLAIHQALFGLTTVENEFDPCTYPDNLQCIGEVSHRMYEGNKQAEIKVFLPLKNPVTGEPTPLDTPF